MMIRSALLPSQQLKRAIKTSQGNRIQDLLAGRRPYPATLRRNWLRVRNSHGKRRIRSYGIKVRLGLFKVSANHNAPESTTPATAGASLRLLRAYLAIGARDLRAACNRSIKRGEAIITTAWMALNLDIHTTGGQSRSNYSMGAKNGRAKVACSDSKREVKVAVDRTKSNKTVTISSCN